MMNIHYCGKVIKGKNGFVILNSYIVMMKKNENTLRTVSLYMYMYCIYVGGGNSLKWEAILE